MKTEDILYKLDDIMSEGINLESLIRPLLEIIENTTGLESVYFTAIDFDQNTQKIVFSRNTGHMNIPEGLTVQWEDTLCKRSLDAGLTFTNDVPGIWGDSNAARALGIKTYVSEPVHTFDNKVYGTLCGASSVKLDISDNAIHLLRLFAHIIARQLEREEMVILLRRMNIQYGKLALSDPLTGVPNRRALIEDLTRMLARKKREGGNLYVAFIDLDGFKLINDAHGHDAGDRFLIKIAQKLRDGLRTVDFLARYGGDEFVVLAMDDSPDVSESIDGFRSKLQKLVCGQFDVGSALIDYPGASIGIVAAQSDKIPPEDLIAAADDAMYLDKSRRRKAK